MKKRTFLALFLGALLVLLSTWWAYAAFILPPVQELELVAHIGGVPGQLLANVSAVDVAMTQDLAFALDDDGLVILDISHPDHPVILSQTPLPMTGSGGALYVYENQVYVSPHYTGALYIIDISQPDSPTISRTIYLTESISDIFAHDARIYLLSQEHLFGMDLAGNEIPDIIYNPGGSRLYVWEAAGRRYVLLSDHAANYYSSKTHVILDITDEGAPQKMGEFSTYYAGIDVIVQENLAFFGSGYVFDISDMAHPVELPFFDAHSTVNIAMEGHHLALAASGALLDVSDHDFFPVIAEPHTPLFGNGRDVAMKNNLEIVALAEGGLQIYRYLPRTAFAQPQEAENGALTPPMTVEWGNASCQNRYVASHQAWSDGAVEFQVEAPEADNYFLWARVAGMDWHRNSFWVSIDGGEPFQFEIRPPDGQWHWQQVSPEHQPVGPFGLTAGPHSLRFLAREADSRLDAIYITNHPELRPTDANPCVAPATPTPTPSPTATPLPPTATPTLTPLPTPPPHDLRPVGRFGGHPLLHASQIAAAQGTRVYVAHDDRFIVIDTQNPYQFDVLGQSAPLPGPITSLEIKGHYLFAQANGLVVVDVSDPQHMQQVTYLTAMSGAIHITGDRLYLVSGRTWVTFDISQPDAPQKIGQVTLSRQYTDLAYPYFDVDFEGNWAYLVRNDRRVMFFDLSDPSTLLLAGFYDAPDNVVISEVLARAPMLYLVSRSLDYYGGDWSITILDISDGAHPQKRGSYTVPGYRNLDLIFRGLALHGDDLYFGFFSNDTNSPAFLAQIAIEILQISDPDHPQYAGSIDTDTLVSPFAVSDTRLFAVGDDVHIFQLTDLKRLPLNPETGDYDGLPLGESIGGFGENSYLWDGEDIRVLDNSRPTAPAEKEKHHLAERWGNRDMAEIKRVYFAGERVYYDYFEYVNADTRTCVKELTDFGEPGCDHSIPFTAERPDADAHLIAASHGYVFLHTKEYVDAWVQRTEIVDVRNLDAMHSVAITDTIPADAEILDCCQEHRYAAWAMNPETGPSTIVITPIDQPGQRIGQWVIDHPVRKMETVGAMLYVLTDQTLYVVDVSQPAHPREMGRYAFAGMQGAVHDLKVFGGWAFVAIGRQVRVVDVLNPAHLVESGVFNAPDETLGLALRPPIISLAAHESGMINLQMSAMNREVIYLPRFWRRR